MRVRRDQREIFFKAHVDLERVIAIPGAMRPARDRSKQDKRPARAPNEAATQGTA